MGINHFLHPHPLKLTEKNEDDEEVCKGCNKSLSGQIYTCDSCQFSLHQSCAELPQEVRCFFHPCVLQLEISAWFTCKACHGEHRRQFTYRCTSCSFDLDIECLQLLMIQPGDGQIQHLCHPHPLTLLAKMDSSQSLCKACERPCLDHLSYACIQCNFYLHKSCLDILPQQLQLEVHPCPFILLAPPSYECPDCKQNHSGLAFGCGKCIFYFCVNCALVRRQSSRVKEIIRIPSHPCPLKLKFSSTFTCGICYGHDSDFTYHCQECDFDMDVGCSMRHESKYFRPEKEKTVHFCHSRPLTLLKYVGIWLEDYSCLICGGFLTDPFYGCIASGFYVHKSCLEVLPQKIQLSFHQCPLILITNPSSDCCSCNRFCLKLSFNCSECQFNVCVSCSLISTIESSQIPRMTQHFFHSCPLILKFSTTFTCNACFGHRSNLTYYCEECDFYMDVDCARQFEDEQNQVRHICHCHPMTLLDAVDCCRASCKICQKLCSEPSFGCCQCGFYIHKSCMDLLPQKVDYWFHNCLLVLYTIPSYECRACDKMCSGLAFRCKRCRYNLCIECALRPMNTFDDHGNFQSSYHRHPLAACQKLNIDEACCYMCGEHCVIGLTYECSACDTFVHKSCAESAVRIRQPIHPQHCLALAYRRCREKLTCDLCLNDCPDCSYVCEECNFQLHIQCARLSPSVKYPAHSHLLIAMEDIHGEVSCNACATSCAGSALFRCLKCNFNLHLQCGPLPCSIKHAYHVHSILLKDFHIEDDEKEKDDFVCHACEEQRDPRLCAYCCTESCFMICHVNCVISEVLASLRGERGEVELRTVGTRIIGKVMSKHLVLKDMEQDMTEEDRIEEDAESDSTFSYDGILDSFDGFEQEEFDDIMSTSKSERTRRKKLWLEREGMTVISYCKEGFQRFMDRLDFKKPSCSLSNLAEQHDGFTKAEKYSLPQTLVPVFEEFLVKHGDVGAKSKISSKTKSYFYLVLCLIIHSMLMTKVADVTEDTLHGWLRSLDFIKQAGFNVDFIYDHVKHNVGRAHFFLEARKSLDETSSTLLQEAEGKSEEIEELEAKLEAAAAELEVIKKNVEAHDAYRKNVITSIKKEYKNASRWRWKPATTGLGLLENGEETSPTLDL